MTRPEIKDFFQPETNLPEIMATYESEPELFAYAKALDAYIDELGDALFEKLNPNKTI